MKKGFRISIDLVVIRFSTKLFYENYPPHSKLVVKLRVTVVCSDFGSGLKSVVPLLN